MIFIYILTFLLYIGYFYISRQTWDIVDTPTVTPSGAIIGLCEVEGKAALPKMPTGESMPVIVAPISGNPCVWFKVKVDWYDANGKDSGWKTFREKSSDGGFRIADKYGSIAVHPDKAETDFTRPINQNESAQVIMNAYNYFVKFPTGKDAAQAAMWTTSQDGYYMWHPNLNQWIPSKYVSPDRKYYFDWVKLKWFQVAPQRSSFFSMLLSLSDDKWSNAQLRVTETVVFPDQDIFAHGHVSITPDGTDLLLGKQSAYRGNCILSTKGQDKVLKKFKIRKWFILGIAVAISTLAVLISGQSSSEVNLEIFGLSLDFASPLGRILILSTLLAMGSLSLKLFRIYNRFVRLREQVRLSRSAIDVSTKRRSSLIPELCDVIDEVMKHEKTVLDAVAQLRTHNPSQASKEIFALAESYPNIMSSTNFLNLQKELGRTEEKIAMARSFLNDSILAMDNLRATLIGMVISPLFAKEQRPNL